MITHILSDGREVDSIEGFVIPPTGATEAVYRIIAEFTAKHSDNTCKHKENKKNATA